MYIFNTVLTKRPLGVEFVCLFCLFMLHKLIIKLIWKNEQASQLSKENTEKAELVRPALMDLYLMWMDGWINGCMDQENNGQNRKSKTPRCTGKFSI